MFHKCNVKLCCEDQRWQGSGGRQRDAQVCVRNKTMKTIEGLMLGGHWPGQHCTILFQTGSNVGVLAESYLAVTDKEQLSQHKDYCPVWGRGEQLEEAAVHLLFMRRKARILDISAQRNLLKCGWKYKPVAIALVDGPGIWFGFISIVFSREVNSCLCESKW